jgi:hypothetical protein
MRSAIFFIGRWTTNAALASLAIVCSVKRDDAVSNISSWTSALGLPDPEWLQSHTADSVIFWGAICGFVALWGAPVFYRKIRNSVPGKVDSVTPQPVRPDLNAIDGFKIAFSRWPGRLPNDIAQEIHDLLRQDKLTAWGRSASDLPQARIAADEWDKIAIDFSSRAIEAKTPDGQTSQACAWTRDIKPKRMLRYVDVLFSRSQFDRMFPGG